jgi:hypothetical protein
MISGINVRGVVNGERDCRAGKSFLDTSSSIVFGSEIKVPALVELDEQQVQQSAGVGTVGLAPEGEDKHGRPVFGG